MRLTRGTTVLLTLADGSAFRGVVARSWRWRTVRLDIASTLTNQGSVAADGYVLVPHRSILVAQVLS